MTVWSILFAKGGFSWVDISLPNWWSSSLTVYGRVLICWPCSYTSWYQPLWRGRHYTLYLPPLQNSCTHSPWTSSGSHNQAWLIAIPSADTGCDSAQWCRVFLPHSHPQSSCWEGIRDPQQVKGTMGGEVFLSEQKCTLPGAFNLPNTQFTVLQLHTVKSQPCYLSPWQLWFKKVPLVTLWATRVPYHLQTTKTAVYVVWNSSEAFLYTNWSKRLLCLLTPDVNLRLSVWFPLGQTTI